MRTINQHIEVGFDYPVHFVSGLFESANDLLARVLGPCSNGAPHRMLVVCDRGVLEHRPELSGRIAAWAARRREFVELVSAPIGVPGGEAAKNDPALVDGLHRAIERHRLDRHSFVLAVGGGAVLDMVGYAAATAHRGVRLIRVPTTVLSQNDSGVGVKNGVNAWGKKNFLGAFAPPFAVLNDREFLSTLHDRDWRAGISEAVKVALLKSRSFFGFIEENAARLVGRDAEAMDTLVFCCAKLHLDHIARSGDPFEFGSSRPLDFGHWAAHRIESLSDFRLRHGEAVAAGICLDATYSHLSGMLPEEPWLRILGLFESLKLPIWVEEFDRQEGSIVGSILGGIEEFREHLGGELTVMMLDDIGRGREVHSVDHALVEESIFTLKNFVISTQGEGPWTTPTAVAR
jgi:3-dehydroquinate synthase